MKSFRVVLLAPFVAVLFACNPVNPSGEDKIDPKYEGLVLNEIAAHDNVEGIDSWVEVCNTSSEARSLDGLKLFVTDNYFNGQKIAELSGSLPAGDRVVLTTVDGSLVTGIDPTNPFTLVLGTDNSVAADRFERKAEDPLLGWFASFQRIPDGTGDWRRVTYSSPGRENLLLDLSRYKNNAVWVWGSHMGDLLSDNCAKLKNLKTLGYDHIILNFAAFDNFRYETMVKKFMVACSELDLVVYGWIQAFYVDGDWVSPVDDANKCYKEELFEKIRNDAKRYIETYGIQGINLDYIRFGGTAYKHNPSADVTAVGAVNKCCREIREVCDSFDEGLITSAALMPEVNSSYYYGQEPAQMAKWIHILMPMIYRYGSYNFNDTQFKSTSNWFANQAKIGGGVSWPAIQTYDASTKGMTAEQIRKDINLIHDTNATGITLFRYQLGTFPDVTDIDWK